MDDDLGDATQAIPVSGEIEPTPLAEPVATGGWVLADRYRVLDRIGSGGMADVFRAHDEQLDRDVAVKVFRTPVDEPGNASAAERREIELRALAQLSHPNLIALYDANVADAHPAFLVTELVVGPNLASRLTDGPLPEELVRTIGAQIADALAYVHARGMVHRDVKPANILLGTDGPDPETATVRARLSDFGIVRVIEQTRMTAAEFTLGTAFYLAPEQARGGDVTAAADVYALGLVLVEMLTGERSFDGPMHEAMAARLDHAPAIPPGLPQPWPGLLTAMTLSDPAARPTAADVAQSLQSSLPPAFTSVPLAPVVSPAPLDVPVPEPAGTPRRHRGAALAAVALACAAVIAGGLILILQPSGTPSTPAVGDTTAPASTGASASAAPSARSSRNDADAPVTAGRSTSASTSASRSTARSSASTTASRTRTATSSAPASSASSSTASRTSSPPTHTTSAPRPSTSTTSKPATSTSAVTTPAAPPASGAPVSGGVVDSASP